MQGNAANKHVIVGLGMTGLSCARFLQSRHIPFEIMDTREQPPALEQFKKEFPGVPRVLGRLDAEMLATAAAVVMSPGVDPRMPEIRQAASNGARLTGDVDLFASEARSPIVAITGSNAKSTVTTLVGEMARTAGLKVAVAGNIGTPVLELLAGEPAELYVLELSSFQLETTTTLGAEVATILNISEDHMDRYDSLDDYRRAKHRIFQGCRKLVVNREDSATWPEENLASVVYSFGLQPDARPGSFALLDGQDGEYLGFNGEPLLAVHELKIAGRHNVLNALAALALGRAINLAWEPMLQTLRNFRGLKHRCQWIRDVAGVPWYNDSKGTNVGATVAAISGLASKGRVVLLAGGVGKGADFSALAPAMANHGRLAILFGEDAGKIAFVLEPVVEINHAASIQDAVAKAHANAQPGDLVLLSPACASFDMFRNYEHRGDVFMQEVEALH
jgi:UDP-N-acetylmuramoylalanine--D-glutamate ligase